MKTSNKRENNNRPSGFKNESRPVPGVDPPKRPPVTFCPNRPEAVVTRHLRFIKQCTVRVLNDATVQSMEVVEALVLLLPVSPLLAGIGRANDPWGEFFFV